MFIRFKLIRHEHVNNIKDCIMLVGLKMLEILFFSELR